MAPTANDNARLQNHQQIQQDIPSCARPCFDYFVSGFPCDGNDLSCLCSQRSSNGFTLGEFAYSCSTYECTTVSREDRQALYNICSGQKSAAKPTLSGTITLPAHPVSYITTTTASSASAVATTAASSEANSSPTNVHASPSSRPTSTQAAATGAPLVATNDGSKEATSLTSGQAVGISVGAMGGLCLAGALIYFLLWCKRRRALKSPKQRKDSFDFIDKGAPRHSFQTWPCGPQRTARWLCKASCGARRWSNARIALVRTPEQWNGAWTDREVGTEQRSFHFAGEQKP
jgi:hypothetical protein